MSFWDNLFGSSEHTNPYKAASPYLDQIPGALNQYYQPYEQLGQQGMQLQQGLQEGYQGLSDRGNQMAQDPGAYQSMLASSFQGTPFQQDPGYQWNVDQQMQAQDQAMAAGGMLGSPEHQQLASALASNLANQQYGSYQNRQDNLFRDYMQNQLGISGAGSQLGMQGLQGLGNLASQDLNYGYGASLGHGRDMQDYFYNRGNLAGGQAQDARNRRQGALGSALGFGSGFMGAF